MKRYGMLIGLAAVLAPAQAAETAATAEKVIACMRANYPPAMRIQDVELTSTDRTGATTTLQGKVYVLREKLSAGSGPLRAMLRIEAPPRLAGAAYLVRETDDYLRDGMFVYLPSVRRVRRVSGTFADGALMGTDFSYYDFKQLSNAFGDLDGKLEGQEKIQGRTTHILSFSALPGVDTRYNGVRAWIDEQSCVPLKAEFIENDKPRKRLTAPVSALQKSGDYWYLAETRMEDLVEGTKTILRISRVKAGEDLPNRYFDPNSFYLVQ